MSNGLLRARPLASLAVLLASAAAALAQKDPRTTVKGTATATIIEVPVNVIGKDGRPLSGLTAADFELYDNGKKQQISGFEVVELQKPAADAAANPFPEAPPPMARRHWLLAFDLSYASPTGLIRAREGARSFIEKDMAASDLAGVATLSIENGWKLIENFTGDKVQLARAIETLGLVKGGVRTSDPLAFAFEKPGPAPDGSSKAQQAVSDALREYFQDLERKQQNASDQRERGRVAQHMSNLGNMAQILDSVRGRKYVLLFSEGFESRILMGNAGQTATPLGETSSTQDTSAEASLHGQTWKIDSDARFGSSATRGSLSTALAGFRRSDVILNTIDISGLRAEGEVTRRAGSGTDALFTMANETNGDFIRNANQLGSDLTKLVERTALVYILAFQPTDLSKPGAFHELSVKVKVPTSRISLRSGYYEPRPYRSLTPIERMLASGDLLAAGGGPAQIPVHMLSAPFSSDGKVAQVPVILEIPGKELVEGDTSPASQIQIYSYASDLNGTLADYLTQEMTLDLKQVGPRLEAGGIKYYGTLFLPPGRYTLRALVRNVFTGRSALATAALTVPSIPGGEATVLPPFFSDLTSSWVMVKTAPRTDASKVAAEYPFAIEGDSFLPAALPVLTSKAAAQVAVMTFNFGNSDKPEPLQILAEVVGPDGKARQITVQTVRRSDKERNGGRALLLSFKPDGLEPGTYVFKVRASDRVSRKTAEAATAFVVRAP
jgi:VWFA-related protein